MIAPPLPFDEPLRLGDLRRLNVLDTPAEQAFDDIAELARGLAGVPYAAVSLIDADRQWFKASCGLGVQETSRSVSFCGYTILDDAVFWVEDARLDERFADNPLVTGEPHIRFYGGAPLIVNGSRIGALCLIDDRPRTWDGALAEQLKRLAGLAAANLESRHEIDRLHGVLSARAEVLIAADEDGLVRTWTPGAEALLGRPAITVLGRPLKSLLAVKGTDEEARENRQARLLVDEVTDYAIYMLDPDGSVTSWNAGSERIKGYGAGEIVGRHFSCFYGEEDQAAGKPAHALRQARATGRFTDEGWRVRKDGSRLWASVVLQARHDGGRFVGFVKITRDLTKRHEADVALQKALAEADAANHAKSEFLANMSHEIRTPLNGVVGVVDVLMRSDLTAAQREMTEIISSSAKTLESLIGDVLDLARIESGQAELRPEPFELAEALAAVTGWARLRAEGKGLTFLVNDQVGPGVWVSADRTRLQQILNNLLGNAVKFTEEGQVALSITMSGDGSMRPSFRFEVRDTGIGFDPREKGAIFGRFQQADGSITRRFGGTGLGMAISRQLATMMKGTLDCDSRPGVGSSFVLSVELECSTPASRPSAELSPACDRALRILLADDHPVNRKVCELILGQLEAEIVTVENGAQAVDAFSQADFDLVLMDMQMPVMDGLSAVRAIRALESRSRSPRTPIYMLSANALSDHVEQARLAGADRHISKPVSAVTLLEAIADIDQPSDPVAEEDLLLTA